jgi:hypothetical protein
MVTELQEKEARSLARLFGVKSRPRIEELPNGRALYFDVSVDRSWLKPGGVLERLVRTALARGGHPSMLLDLQRGAVGDSGVPVKTQVVVFQISLTPASVATIVAVEQAFTVSGILASDILAYAANSVDAATAVGATTGHVTAANTIKLGYVNPTAGALVPTAGTYNIVVLRG